MEVGLEPKDIDIKIRIIADKYEIYLNDEMWFYLDLAGVQKLRDKISEALDPSSEDEDIDILREKDDYIDGIGNGNKSEINHTEHIGDENDGEI